MGRGRAITIWLACLAALMAVPGSAAAQIGIETFSFGLSTAQAGAHPDLHAAFSFKDPGEPETAKEARLDLAPGFWLDSGALPRCAPTQFSESNCPLDTQVGTATVRANFSGSPHFLFETAGVYLLLQESGELARLGFVIPGLGTPIEAAVLRDGARDGLDLAFEELPTATPLADLELDLWGVPSAPAHDEERGPSPSGSRPVSPELPFTRNPTACELPTATLSARSYEDPDAVASSETSGPAITGCSKVSSLPSLSVTMTSNETAMPSGLNVDLLNPQDQLPQDFSTSDLKAIALDLDGLEVKDETASSHSSCTPAQFELGSNAPAACPAASRIGTFVTVVPAAEERLEGSVFLGGGDGAGNYRIFLSAANPSLELKLLAWLEPGGEPWLVFPELPQLPLEEMAIAIDPAASLFTTVPECGSFTKLDELETWSEPTTSQIFESAFIVDSGPRGGPCPVPAEQTSEPSTSVAGSNGPAAPAVPILTFRKHPPHRGHDRTPSFSFSSGIPTSTFLCKVDHRPWHPCRPPLTLRKLIPGRHSFRVKAVAPGGIESPPLTYRFVLIK